MSTADRAAVQAMAEDVIGRLSALPAAARGPVAMAEVARAARTGGGARFLLESVASASRCWRGALAFEALLLGARALNL
ncbi:hypothetical protein FNF28_05784 [Cafeteria roenbergensis]|uniref:Uncharacterized protein n=1 Tax=Cafeteria roenbergensis TaxID=33653 RepID=A0A5A8D412_CAFRO|nr:hypothetical protein FNF28_05784 [Cafeteria roenbergensis]